MANEFRVKNGIISPNIGTDSGDFTIDSAGDIIFDADGTDITLKDGGTAFGSFKRASSDFIIKAEDADNDIIFKGIDGSSVISALTLDMSEAGAATFNSGVTIGGNLTIPDDIVHSGDTNNLISFGTDTQSFETGGTARMNISDSGLQIGSGSRVTTILDENNMASDSDTALATQQSIKKYVDDSVGSAGGGDITAVTAGVGLSGGGTTGGVTLTLDMSELTDMTDDVTDNADEFIILDGGADRRKMMNEIDVGGFRDVITGPFHFETDQENVALGEGALDSLTQYVSGLVPDGGNHNTAIGENAGTAVSTGDNNTLLGHDAGETITTGSSNTVIGASAEPSAVNASNQIVIGSGAVGLADNAVVLGNTSITAWLPPDDAGVDLGSSSYQFKDGYFHGTLEADAITVNGTATAVSGGAFHDGFSDFVANEHIDHTSVTLTAGDGLSGGGTIAANRTFAVEAAQTTITSIHATDLIIGEDAQTAIDFGTADEIDFKAANAVQLTLSDGVFRPQTDSDVDLGTSSIFFKDAFIDKITTTGNIELGHASDTTIARASSGVISVEGNNVIMASNDVSALTDSTSAAIGIGTIELGHASDTTIARGSAGEITVEGVEVVLAGSANHDDFSDFVANEHIDHSGVTITAGDGLTGGGTIASTRTLNVVGGDGITANANDVAITAAQTTITSILNASLVAGRDDHNQIKFSTDDQIIFRVGNADGVTFKASGEIEATSLDISGDADIGDDLTLSSDAAVINFGGNSEIKLTHVHDTGLLLTDSGGSPTLQLHDANESVSSDGSKLILTSNGVAFSMPTADGSNGQQLTTNGSGTLSWAASGSGGGSGISDIVEDTSPQLGGDLDTNGHDIIIDDGKGIYADAISNGRELLLFQHTTNATAYLQVWNGISDAATGTLFGNDVVHTDTTNIGRITGPGIEATGSATDVGMSFRTKGLGQFTFFQDDTSDAGSPVINLVRYVDDGDVADDDVLGQIKWMGGQSSMVSPFLHDLRTYARIEANLVDQTSGTTDGNLMFSTMVANSHTDYLEVGTNKTNDTSAGVRAYTGSMVTVSGTGTTALSRDTHAGAYVRATGAGTFTLWDNPNIGDQVVVISDHGGTTTIDGYSSDTINGAANTTITTQYNAKTFIATSTTTWIALG